MDAPGRPAPPGPPANSPAPGPGPLLRSLTVANWKAFGAQPTTVPLAPITLVYGANSAGKSSLLTSLLVLRQSLVGNPFQAPLLLRGPWVDAGSFRSAVHHHDTSRRITLGLSYRAPHSPGPGTPFVPDDALRDATLTYAWDSRATAPYVHGLQLDIADLPSLRLRRDDLQRGRFSPAPGSAAAFESFVDHLVSRVTGAAAAAGGTTTATGALRLGLGLPEDAPLGLPVSLRHFGFGDAVTDPRADVWDLFATAARSELTSVLRRVSLLGPFRRLPDRTVALSEARYRDVGPDGEHAVEVLHDEPGLLAEVNEWFARLGIGYGLDVVNPQSAAVSDSAGDLATLVLVDRRSGASTLVSPRAVGFGVSQVMPIVVQSLLTRDGVVVVQQPELHLHPKLQAQVGDLFIHAMRTRGAQFLIETHSEHLLLRLSRRIRTGALAASDVCVLYVDTLDDGGAWVRRLDLDDDGEMIDEWPGGFFDDRLDEMLARE